MMTDKLTSVLQTCEHLKATAADPSALPDLITACLSARSTLLDTLLATPLARLCTTSVPQELIDKIDHVRSEHAADLRAELKAAMLLRQFLIRSSSPNDHTRAAEMVRVDTEIMRLRARLGLPVLQRTESAGTMVAAASEPQSPPAHSAEADLFGNHSFSFDYSPEKPHAPARSASPATGSNLFLADIASSVVATETSPPIQTTCSPANTDQQQLFFGSQASPLLRKDSAPTLLAPLQTTGSAFQRQTKTTTASDVKSITVKRSTTTSGSSTKRPSTASSTRSPASSNVSQSVPMVTQPQTTHTQSEVPSAALAIIKATARALKARTTGKAHLLTAFNSVTDDPVPISKSTKADTKTPLRLEPERPHSARIAELAKPVARRSSPPSTHTTVSPSIVLGVTHNESPPAASSATPVHVRVQRHEAPQPTTRPVDGRRISDERALVVNVSSLPLPTAMPHDESTPLKAHNTSLAWDLSPIMGSPISQRGASLF